MDHLVGNRILIFLPKGSALIAARLDDIGYVTSIACSVPDLREALASEDYRLVVTTRPDIDTVRDIEPLPVINLEIFFHPDPHGASPDIGTKQFDSKAFLRRVKALTEPGRAREKPAANAASPRGRGRWFWRLFQPSPAGAGLSS
jgi:hypothetical protein